MKKNDKRSLFILVVTYIIAIVGIFLISTIGLFVILYWIVEFGLLYTVIRILKNKDKKEEDLFQKEIKDENLFWLSGMLYFKDGEIYIDLPIKSTEWVSIDEFKSLVETYQIPENENIKITRVIPYVKYARIFKKDEFYMITTDDFETTFPVLEEPITIGCNNYKITPEKTSFAILQDIGGTIDKRAIIFGAYSPNRFKEIAETYKFNNKE